MADRIGQQFGNYRLIRLLGKGGFAEVYLGEHAYIKRQAAVKILHSTLAQKELEKFLIEAQRLIDVAHPHIIRVLDFAIEDGIPFLVMEYAANGTLRTRYPKGSQLSLETLMPYVMQTASALQYIHDQKLVHRDIKPENMLLGAQQELLLSDFGIAAIAHATNSLDLQGRSGTPPYMAPEQIQGKPRPASDQYALGVIVYEWLSGYPPFRGSISEIIGQHMFADPPLLHEKVPTLSPEVEEVILKALAKDPRERFDSVQLFAQSLEQACHETTQVPTMIVRQTQSQKPLAPSIARISTEILAADGSATPESTRRLIQTASHTPTGVPLPENTIPTYSTEYVAEERKTPDLSQPTTSRVFPSPIPSPQETHQQKPEVSQTRKRAISRRAIMAGLAALIAGGGITYIVTIGKTGSQINIPGSSIGAQSTQNTLTPQATHNASSTNTTSTSPSNSTPPSPTSHSTPSAKVPSQGTPGYTPQATPQATAQSTAQPGTDPTAAPTTQVAALTLQITNCPSKVNNNTDVPVTVSANAPGVDVQLVVTYDLLSDVFRSLTKPTDNNNTVVLTWHVGLLSSLVSGLVGANVTAVAKDQNGQQVHSQTVKVQVALALL